MENEVMQTSKNNMEEMTVEKWLGEDNKLGVDIWHNKYQHNNETFEQWLDRITNKNEELKKLIIEKKFLFGGRILANRGLHKEGKKITYSNCYVVTPPEDNIESIYEAVSKLARTFSFGGGAGTDISKLSPRGARINNAAETTSGAVSFMDTFSQVTEQIGQQGRRGALMISIDCTHPDLEEFINVKTDLNRVNKANISVRVSDDFMNAVLSDSNFTLKYNREETGEVIRKTIKAKQLFRRLAENNWNFAEPGCLFWDNINNNNLMSNNKDFSYAGTNPCAEQPLPAGGSCSLSSINLSAFVNENKEFDFEEFKRVVKLAVIAQNDILDEGMNLHPLKEQRESVKKWRQIGIGIMGLADMLIKMEIEYDSIQAINLCDEIGKVMAETAIQESVELAKEKGCFEACTEEVRNGIIKTKFFENNHSEENKQLVKDIKEYGLRNSQILTIAPTGTLSTMLGISGGIEPIFEFSYTRKTESLKGHDEYYKVFTPIVDAYMKENKIKKEEDLPDFFVNAHTINYKDRIEMQGIWQKHIDASISSTVNLKEETTIDEVFDLYCLAWEKGLKGVTIFRDNCKRVGILTKDGPKKEEKEEPICPGPKRGEIIPCSDNIIGLKKKITTGCGSLHIMAYFDPETKALQEVYLSKGSTGGCANFMNGLSRFISLACRAGVKIEDIKDQLDSCGTCPSYASRRATLKDTSKGSSCPVAIGYALMEMYREFKKVYKEKETKQEVIATAKENAQEKKVNEQEMIDKGLCPKCGEPMVRINGCITCKSCGWSKCD